MKWSTNMDEELLDEPEQEQQPTVETFDLSNVTPVNHTFERIVGNQLVCTEHNSLDCPSITVKPTQVLEFDKEGRLQLVDKAPR